jgi:hypothetical protein
MEKVLVIVLVLRWRGCCVGLVLVLVVLLLELELRLLLALLLVLAPVLVMVTVLVTAAAAAMVAWEVVAGLLWRDACPGILRLCAAIACHVARLTQSINKQLKMKGERAADPVRCMLLGASPWRLSRGVSGMLELALTMPLLFGAELVVLARQHW